MAATPPEAEQIPGQMTVYECIVVASTGIDGKPPVSPDRPMSVAEIVRNRLKGAK